MRPLSVDGVEVFTFDNRSLFVDLLPVEDRALPTKQIKGQ